MDACLLFCVCFNFSVLNQEIGLGERLQSDLFVQVIYTISEICS